MTDSWWLIGSGSGMDPTGIVISGILIKELWHYNMFYTLF